MLLSLLQAKNVARQVECQDLTATIIAEPHGAHSARDDAVDVFGRLPLPKNLLVAGEMLAYPLQNEAGPKCESV